MFRYFTIGLVILLSGCSLFSNGESPIGKANTPGQRLLALEAEYNGLFFLFKSYQDLKRCSVTASAVCAKQAVVDKTRAINTAFDTTTEAAWAVIRVVEDSPSAKEAALSSVLIIMVDARDISKSIRDVISSSKSGEK